MTDWYYNKRLLKNILALFAQNYFLPLSILTFILVCTLNLWEYVPRVLSRKYPHVLTSYGFTTPRAIQIHMAIIPCTYFLQGIDTHGYSSISCLTNAWLRLLPLDMILLLFLGILLFECFLELLGYEFPCHTPTVKPWGMLLLLLQLQNMICCSVNDSISRSIFLFPLFCF